jgi:hypothetical protein
MIDELDTVVLTRAIESHDLETGDVGTVVHVYDRGAAFEVEFVTAEGRMVALLTLRANQIRPIGDGEILHVRELTATQP